LTDFDHTWYIYIKCDRNRSRGYGALRGWAENGTSPLLSPVAYTTACTTVQAVISNGTMFGDLDLAIKN